MGGLPVSGPATTHTVIRAGWIEGPPTGRSVRTTIKLRIHTARSGSIENAVGYRARVRLP